MDTSYENYLRLRREYGGKEESDYGEGKWLNALEDADRDAMIRSLTNELKRREQARQEAIRPYEGWSAFA